MNTKIYFAGANIIAAGAPHDGQTRKRTWNDYKQLKLIWNGWGKSNHSGAMPVGQRCLQQPATRRWTCKAQFPRQILGTSATFTDGVPVFLLSWQKHSQLDITSAFRLSEQNTANNLESAREFVWVHISTILIRCSPTIRTLSIRKQNPCSPEWFAKSCWTSILINRLYCKFLIFHLVGGFNPSEKYLSYHHAATRFISNVALPSKPEQSEVLDLVDWVAPGCQMVEGGNG